MVEVFKTNVNSVPDAHQVLNLLSENFPSATANFDLADVDNILRVDCGAVIDTSRIIAILEQAGFAAEVLEDNPADITGYL